MHFFCEIPYSIRVCQATSPCTSRKPRVQETASGDTPDPVVQKKNELFYNNVENFKENLRAESSVSASQGIFLWPCPSSNHITSYFGYCTPSKQGDSSDHKGIDIGASMGAQVIAAAAGKVTTVSYNSARGYFIVVDHGSGYQDINIIRALLKPLNIIGAL